MGKQFDLPHPIDLPKIRSGHESAYQFVETITERLCSSETPIKFASGQDLHKVLTILRENETILADHFDDPEMLTEVLSLLEKRIADTDFVTGLERREKQTERLRDAIKSAAEAKENFKQNSRRIGFISFDVRGLKMVNDVMKDHKYGDEYLRKIKEIVIEHVIPRIQQLVGENARIHLARDGGDEFSILIENSERDLNEDFSFTDDNQSEIKPLIQHINDFVNARLAAEVNTLIPREKLIEFMGEDMPDDFELRFFVASGAATLSEIVEDPHNEYFKTDIEKEAEGKGPTSGKDIVNTLLSALRTKADTQSYEVKSEQNKNWINSNDPHDQAMIRIISRNDVTISLAKKAQKEHLRANELSEQLTKTTEALDTCLVEKERLTVK